jgi:hypothetical protein
MFSSANFNLSYLEKLSTPELRDLAANFGIDIPRNLERLFIIEEILDNAPCLAFFQPHRPASPPVETGFTDNENIPPLPDPVELPKQYNITQITAIVRDPLWVFVFWEIRDADRRIYERRQGFHGYFLRVSLDKCKMGDTVSTMFTIPVSSSDSEWYIHFPPDGYCRKICNTAEDAPFNVALCAAYSGGESVLAATHPFRLPRMLEFSMRSAPAHNDNTLLLISGIDDLPVLRNREHIPAVPAGDGCCHNK